MATMPRTRGSLRWIMDEVVEMERAVHPDLTVFRWQPRRPQLPGIWNWINNAPFEQRDLARWRDNIELLVRVGIQHNDVDEEMAQLEEYADALRETIDRYLAQDGDPFNGAVYKAQRTGMRTVGLDTGDVLVLAVEFPILLWVDRILR